jgi:hypothetical protein
MLLAKANQAPFTSACEFFDGHVVDEEGGGEI